MLPQADTTGSVLPQVDPITPLAAVVPSVEKEPESQGSMDLPVEEVRKGTAAAATPQAPVRRLSCSARSITEGEPLVRRLLFSYDRPFRQPVVDRLLVSAQAGGASIPTPPELTIPISTVPEQTPEGGSHHTTDTSTHEGAPWTAAHTSLATPAAMVEGAPPRSVRRAPPGRAATRG